MFVLMLLRLMFDTSLSYWCSGCFFVVNFAACCLTWGTCVSWQAWPWGSWHMTCEAWPCVFPGNRHHPPPPPAPQTTTSVRNPDRKWWGKLAMSTSNDTLEVEKRTPGLLPRPADDYVALDAHRLKQVPHAMVFVPGKWKQWLHKISTHTRAISDEPTLIQIGGKAIADIPTLHRDCRKCASRLLNCACRSQNEARKSPSARNLLSRSYHMPSRSHAAASQKSPKSNHDSNYPERHLR